MVGFWEFNTVWQLFDALTSGLTPYMSTHSILDNPFYPTVTVSIRLTTASRKLQGPFPPPKHSSLCPVDSSRLIFALEFAWYVLLTLYMIPGAVVRLQDQWNWPEITTFPQRSRPRYVNALPETPAFFYHSILDGFMPLHDRLYFTWNGIESFAAKIIQLVSTFTN